MHVWEPNHGPVADGASSKRYPGFHSFKTLSAIPYPRRWLRDPLLLSTFDNDVRSISLSPMLWQQSKPEVEFAYAIHHSSKGKCLVVLGEGPFVDLNLPQNVDEIIPVSRMAIYYHPYVEFVRGIWARKRLVPDLGDQIRLLLALSREPDGKTLGELVALCRSERLDPVNQVLSLVANGVFSIDIGRTLSPHLRIRVRDQEKIDDIVDGLVRRDP